MKALKTVEISTFTGVLSLAESNKNYAHVDWGIQMMSTSWGKKTQQGFTLIELMVTLTVLAILTLTATPALSAALEHQKLKQAALDLKIGLQEARSRAVLARSAIVVCPNKGEGVFADAIDRDSCRAQVQQIQHSAGMLTENHVSIIAIDSTINLKPGSSTHVMFSAQGYTAQQQITLCGKQHSYSITVYIPGNVAVQQGGACV